MALDEKSGDVGSEKYVRRRRVTAVTSSEEFSSTRRTSSTEVHFIQLTKFIHPERGGEEQGCVATGRNT